MRRSFLAALCVALVSVGCSSDGTTLLETSAEADRADDFVVRLGTAGPNFQFAPPVAAPVSPSDPFDDALAPRVEVCEGTASVCASPLVTFTESTSPAVRVAPNEELYVVDWNTGRSAVKAGTLYRIRVFVGPLELGETDVAFQPAANGVVGNATTFPLGTVIPIRFRIEEGALPGASGCTINPQVLDCDVIQVPVSNGGVVQVGNPVTDEFASEVAVAAGDAIVPNGEPHFVLSLEHIVPAPPVSLATPWVPFFARATARDSDGNAVTFRNGADFVLCQPETLSDPTSPRFLPVNLHDYLQIIRVSSGQVFPLPTSHGAPQCAGPGSAPNRIVDDLSFAQGLTEGFTRFANLWRPTPLRALHGGLNTRGLLGFSEFGATLPVNARASSATVPAGVLGSPTVMLLQTAVAPGVPHPFGGGLVQGAVAGANAGAVVSVVDNRDGTYTLSYVPTRPGTDQITILIDNTPIGGSPYGSGVAASGFGTATIDGVRSPGEWDDAIRTPIFSGPYAGSTLYRMNDADMIYFGVDVRDADPNWRDVLRIRFDNDVDGFTRANDDELRLDPLRFQDNHYAGFWALGDVVSNGAGAVGYTERTTFHEISHPLDSGDGQDFSVKAGDELGFCVIFLEHEVTSTDKQYPSGCGNSPFDQSGYGLLRVVGAPN